MIVAYTFVASITLIPHVVGYSLLDIPVTTPIEVVKPSPVTIDGLISFYAKKYKVSSSTMHHIIFRESTYNVNAEGDLDLICERTGESVYARGLVQITRCWFPEVSDEQAFDPEFSIHFLAKGLASGKCSVWWLATCPY